MSHPHGHGHSHGACGCGEEHGDEHKEGAGAGNVSLLSLVDVPNVKCLNEATPGAGKTVFKPWDQRDDVTKFVESEDGDAELLFIIPFTEGVNLRSIAVFGGPDGSCPATVKLFINRDDIDFTNVHDLRDVQTLNVADGSTPAMDYPLKPTKFNGVHKLVLFIAENHGADQTKLYYIGLKGAGTNVRHGILEAVYEARANVADHKTRVEGTGASSTIS